MFSSFIHTNRPIVLLVTNKLFGYNFLRPQIASATMRPQPLLKIYLAVAAASSVSGYQCASQGRADQCSTASSIGAKNVGPAFARRTLKSALHLHPDQASELEEAGEKFIRSCKEVMEDDKGDDHIFAAEDDATFTRNKNGSSSTNAGGAASSTGAKPTSSFAFARTLFVRQNSRPQPPFDRM